MGYRKHNFALAARGLFRWLQSTYYAAVVRMGANTAASTDIDGTQEAETAFDKKVTLPANLLETGGAVRIRAQGIHTLTTGSETHSLALKIGSVTIVSAAAIDPANNDIFYIDALVEIRAAGASGTIAGCGSVLAAGQSGTGTTKAFALAATTLDTTVANDVAVFIDRQASATDSDSARLDIIDVEYLPPTVAAPN